jgi:hypothetical protein
VVTCRLCECGLSAECGSATEDEGAAASNTTAAMKSKVCCGLRIVLLFVFYPFVRPLSELLSVKLFAALCTAYDAPSHVACASWPRLTRNAQRFHHHLLSRPDARGLHSPAYPSHIPEIMSAHHT